MEIEQGSDEWHDIRLGRVTGTLANKIKTPGSKMFYTACASIACERIYGVSPQSHTNCHTQSGVLLEVVAKELFTRETGILINNVGFVQKGDNMGCSPDGLTESSVVEVKCPLGKNHKDTLEKPSVQYRSQMQWNMMICGYDICHYIVFSLPHGMAYRIIEADKKEQERLYESALSAIETTRKFLEALDAL